MVWCGAVWCSVWCGAGSGPAATGRVAGRADRRGQWRARTGPRVRVSHLLASWASARLRHHGRADAGRAAGPAPRVPPPRTHATAAAATRHRAAAAFSTHHGITRYERHSTHLKLPQSFYNLDLRLC